MIMTKSKQNIINEFLKKIYSGEFTKEDFRTTRICVKDVKDPDKHGQE